jgi:GNAT superfamily N-acetyltransferase
MCEGRGMKEGTRMSEVQLEFRDMEPGDMTEISGLCPCCVYWELPDHFNERPSMDAMRLLKERWLIKHSDGRVLGKTARAGNEIAGFIQFGPPELYPQRLSYASQPVSEDAMLITCLFVTRRYRGLGVARRLVALAEEVAAREYGYAAIEVFARKGSTNNPSGPVELYLAWGFEVLRNDTQDGRGSGDFPLMRKELSRDPERRQDAVAVEVG